MKGFFEGIIFREYFSLCLSSPNKKIERKKKLIFCFVFFLPKISSYLLSTETFPLCGERSACNMSQRASKLREEVDVNLSVTGIIGLKSMKCNCWVIKSSMHTNLKLSVWFRSRFLLSLYNPPLRHFTK